MWFCFCVYMCLKVRINVCVSVFLCVSFCVCIFEILFLTHIDPLAVLLGSWDKNVGRFQEGWPRFYRLRVWFLNPSGDLLN